MCSSDLKNVHLDAVEYGDDIIFMHSVKPGPANQSYGLQVARLAGIPAHAIQLARQKLQLLEQQSIQSQPDLFSELPLPEPTGISILRDELDAVDVDDLTPRQALDLIYHLKTLAKS